MDVKLQHNVTTVCPIGIPPSTDWETALRGSSSIEPESGGTVIGRILSLSALIGAILRAGSGKSLSCSKEATQGTR